MIGLMSFLEQLNETGFSWCRPAPLLVTRSSVPCLRHSAAPSGWRAMAWGRGCQVRLLPVWKRLSPAGEPHVRSRSLALAWGARGARGCLPDTLPRAERSARPCDERDRDKEGDPGRPERVPSEDIGQPVRSEIHAGGADDEDDDGCP